MEPNAVEDVAAVEVASPVRRRRVRVTHVVVLVLAVVAVAGAAVFAVMSNSDRDAAVRARHVAERRLSSQRDETSIAKRKLSTRRLAVRLELAAIRAPFASAKELGAMAAEEVDAARATQAAGADPNASADVYNETVDRSNEIVDRYNALLDKLQEQLDETPGVRGEIA